MYRADIDGLRGLSVLAVAGFHYFPQQVPGGFAGVDVFFVISGYLITSLILRDLSGGSFSLKIFYLRRVRRLFPALTVVLTFTLAAGWFLLSPIHLQSLGKHVLAAATFSSNFVLMRDAGYFEPAAESIPLLHLWSLAIEEQFYLVWPLILLVIWPRRWMMMAAGAILAVMSLHFSLARTGYLPAVAFYSPISRIWEFIAGAILAGVRFKIPPAMPGIVSATGFALIFFAVLIFGSHIPYPGWPALVPVAGTMFIIAAGPDAWFNRRIFARPILAALGRISYAFYLWHWPVLFFARRAWSPFNPPDTVQKLTWFGLSLALAILTYRFVEIPLRFGQPSRLKHRGLIAGLAILGAAGLLVMNAKGVPSRIPADVQQLLASGKGDWLEQRHGKCFLSGLDWRFPEPDLCSESKRPLVFLWGDSHMASLYPGINEYARATGRFGVAQLNAARCAPLVTYNLTEGTCGRINQFILGQIERLKPDLVLLHAAWESRSDIEGLEPTLKELKRLGIAKVAILGPPNEWLAESHQIAFDQWLKGHLSGRTGLGRAREPERIELELRTVTERNSVSYLSILERLCTTEGCRLFIDGDPKRLITYDNKHLTPAGSRHLAELLMADLLSLLEK